MKAKKYLVIALALAIALCPIAAYASSSPGGSTVTESRPSRPTTATTPNVTLGTVSETTTIQLYSAAEDFVAQTFGDGYVATPMLTVDIQYSGTGSVNVNVSGAVVGGTYYAAHQKADGTIEILTAVCNTPGVITLSSTSYSPVTIFRVDAKEGVGTNVVYDYYTLPQTGNQTNAVPTFILMAISVIALAASAKALVRNSSNK